jgi:hypothetical protein
MGLRLRSFSVALLAAAAAVAAQAQLRMPMQLPENDFVWAWGRAQRPTADARRGIGDFTIYGNEGGFRCELSVRLGIASGLSNTETRGLEAELRASLFFIQDAAYAMNELDYYNSLDWAILDCKKPESNETEDELAEREAKARERAERRRERRRSRED